jgi:hypothetical protein
VPLRDPTRHLEMKWLISPSEKPAEAKRQKHIECRRTVTFGLRCTLVSEQHDRAQYYRAIDDTAHRFR